MTAPVLFFPPPAAPAGSEAKISTPAAENNSAVAPFSRMLDHAVRETPARNSKPDRPDRQDVKESKSASVGRSERTEAKPESEPRQSRVKSGKRDREEAENLASACSVATPAPSPPPDETVVAESESGDPITTVAATDDQKAAAATAMSPVAAKPAILASPTASLSLISTDLKTATETDAASDASPIDDDASLIDSLAPATSTEVSTGKSSSTKTDAVATPPLLADTAQAVAPTMTTTPELALVQSSTIDLQNLETGDPTSLGVTGIVADAEFSTANAAPVSGLASTSAQSAVATTTSAATAPDVTVSNVATVAANNADSASDSAPEEVRRSVRAARRARIEASEDLAGIGGAKSSVTMKTATKKEELAGGAEQFLPVSSPNALSALRSLPGEANRKAAGQFSAVDAVEAAAKASTSPQGTTGTDTETLFIRSASPMNRISEVISREIRMFKRGGDDLVEVVLTPDAKTQISLRLQWRDGQVEVQARCDLGNYQTLNTEWTQLQQSLANHGVRLSHLSERVPTGFTEFFNNPSFAQQHQREQSSQSPAGNPEPLPILPATIAKPSPTPVVRRGNSRFDSWA